MKYLRTLTALAGAVLLAIVASNTAGATINSQISFQGKLTNPDGTNVADGTYSIRFRIYTDPSADTGACVSTCKWEETHGSLGVSGGLFHVNLGSAGSTLPGSVDFNNATLYLGVKVSTDAEMTPRVRLTAAPYAFNSDTLDGLDSAAFVQLSGGNINIGSGTITSGAVNGISVGSTIQPSAAGALTVRSNGANALTLTSGAAATWSTTAGALTVQGFGGVTINTPGASGATSAISILSGNSSAGTAGNVTIDTGTTSTGTPTVNIANANAKAVQVGNSSSNPAVTIDSGTGTINIGTGGQARSINLGTGAAAQAVTVGSTNGTSSLTLQAGSGNIVLNGATLQRTAVGTTTLNLIDGSNTVLSVTNSGTGTASINADGGYQVAGTPGATVTCSGGQFLQNQVVNGGLVTGGTCASAGGGGSPGGSDTHIQFNNAGAFGADADFAWLQSSNSLVLSGADSELIITGVTNEPTAPASGSLTIYSKDIAGRMLPKWKGPSGLDTPFQAGLGFNRVIMVNPLSGGTCTTAVQGFGTAFTNTGTCANPTPTSTNLLTSVRRTTFSSGTTAGTVASHRQAMLQVWRGNAADRGGFFYTIRFGTSTLASGNRAFVGLSDSIAAPTNVDPTTSGTIGKLGMAINANTGNWNVVHNVAGTAPTIIGLGANFPVNNSALYELVLFSAPNGSSIGYRVTNLSTGNQTSGTISTNMPAATTFLAPQFWITNNATAAAAIMDFSGWYLESDY
jgi:hypothetical protein